MKKILCFGDSNVFGFIAQSGDRYDEKTRWSGILKELIKNEYRLVEEGCNNRTCFCNNAAGIKQTGYKYLPCVLDESYDILSANFGLMYTSNVTQCSNLAYNKGDHIRLNELYLGYDLPMSLLDKQGVFSRVNIYARASNLGLIWSANGEFDPDYTIGNLKPMPTFMFGLKLAFKNWK